MTEQTSAVPTPRGSATSTILRFGIALGGLAGGLGVMLMAMAAHVDTTGYVRTAAEMLLFHAPALLAVGALAQVRRIPLLAISMILLPIGLGLFCGDLLSRAFWDQRLFAMSAPTGGMMLIVGWISVALSAIRILPR